MARDTQYKSIQNYGVALSSAAPVTQVGEGLYNKAKFLGQLCVVDNGVAFSAYQCVRISPTTLWIKLTA